MPPQPAIVKKGVRKAGPGAERNEATGDFPFKGLFAKPAASKSPTSYMKVVSEPGDYIGGGKSYDYTGEQLNIRATKRGIAITVDGWRFEAGAPQDMFIKVGEYPDAARFAFSGTAPGLDFSGKGRGSNKLTGAFVVWELEIKGDQVVKLALDFEQHSEGGPAGLTGKIRVNSKLE